MLRGRTSKSVEYGKALLIPTVITDSTLSPATKRADVALVVPIRLWFYVMSAALLSLISALLIAVALRHEDDARPRLEHLDEMFQ